MRRVEILLIVISLLFSVQALAQDWGPLQFLLGTWTTDQPSTGARALGTGSFSFSPDLQGKVLVRKSFAEYPPENGKPAYRHDDLMIVYRDGDSHLRAMYFDNEDHVIEYSVQPSAHGVVFESQGSSVASRYRLTYTATGADHAKLKFEIALPEKDFTTYIEASVHREGAGK
jgi:hypothetical protein